MDKFKSIKFGGGEKKDFKQDLKNKFSIPENLNLKSKLDLKNSLSSINMAKEKLLNSESNLLKKILVPVLAVLLVLGVFLFFVVINPILSLRESVMKIQKDASQTSTSLINDRDLVAYEENLQKVEADFNNLRSERDKKIGHLKNFPYIKNYYSDVDIFINTGLKLVEAGKQVRPVIEPFADAMGVKISKDQEVRKVGFAQAVSTWISVMPKVAQNLDPIINKLDEAGKELNKVDASKYNINILGIYRNDLRPAITFAQTTLSQVRSYGPDTKEALLIFPGVLGVGTGEQRYMIIMQNNAEIRATGGFWTNFATFKINNALLTSDFTSKDMYSIDIALDAIDKYVKFPTVPSAYNKHLKVERMYARDTNISPDFPTAIAQFNIFYNMAQRVNPVEFKTVNGYIAINTEVVKEFMEITGPVTVNGVIFNKDNVVLELEKIASLSLAQQAGRKKVLGDLMFAMLKNVFESDSFLWPQLINKGVDLMNRKQILVYLNDPNAQRLIEKYGYGGRVVEQPQGSDYNYFVSTNLGGDKTNMFIKKEVTSISTIDNGKILRTVKVKYTYPQPSAEYGDFVKRYQDWYRLYVPEDAQFVSLTGNLDSDVYQNKERGKVYFGGFMTLEPNKSHEVEFKYYLPMSYIKNNQYNLYIQKQPGTSNEKYNFDLFGNKSNKVIDTDFTLNVATN